VISAGYDQFAANVLLGAGAWHQWSRDVAFMATDVAGVAMATGWWWDLARRNSRIGDVSRDEILLAVVAVILLFVLSLIT